MSTTSEARALPFFSDLFGLPLESGSIYIGQAGLDPVAYPAVVTSDVAGLVVLQQPIRTVHGHATAAGALVHMFCPIPYSITILDAAGRLVYSSLNETDPITTVIGTSSVQSASSFADLRSRDKNSINQIWVSTAGMYVYQPADFTSPENVPFVIVGNDGGRYNLDRFWGNLTFAKISGASSTPNSQGVWVSWNDSNDGVARFTNNRGTGTGGFLFRNVSADGATETGRVSIAPNGTVTAGGDVIAGGNLTASGGKVFVSVDGTKSIFYDVPSSSYVLPNGGLVVNGFQAVTDQNMQAKTSATLSTIFQTKAVGGLTLTTGSAPPDPGSWAAIVTGVGSTGISLWVRTA